ncbi:MAG: hypothetical protein HQM08_09465 [Candidatus Riflebacteria bacterium]|nr:hypothetical protein [Candidatus Riflebacteria bacterium]
MLKRIFERAVLTWKKIRGGLKLLFAVPDDVENARRATYMSWNNEENK